MPVPGSMRLAAGAERRFYGGMALAILAVAILGFARTYFLRPILPVPTPAPPALTHLVHLHAFLFAAWVGAAVHPDAARGCPTHDLHRRLGVIAAGVAIVMVVVGALVALHAVSRGVAPFGMDHASTIPDRAAGRDHAVCRVRRRRNSHPASRLAGAQALHAARNDRAAATRGGAVGPAAGTRPTIVLAVATLFLVPLFAWDWKALGRIHPVTFWGGLAIAASGPLRLLVARTDEWSTVSHWLVSLVA